MTDNLLDQTADQGIDPNKNYLEELVGADKKFKSPEELARGKAISDAYIETLVKQKDELRQDYLALREEYNTRAKLEEVLDRLNSQSGTPPNPNGNTEDDKPPFDPAQLDSLVSTKIQQHEAERRQNENFRTVQEKLREKFGANYANILKQQIDELGLTSEDVNALARKSPNAFFKTFGLDGQRQSETFQSPPQSQRSDHFAPTGAQKRTWDFYQKLRKSQPDVYYDPKTQVQMHNDAIAMKDAFYG